MGMTPNQLTLLAILLSAFMGFSIWLHTRLCLDIGSTYRLFHTDGIECIGWDDGYYLRCSQRPARILNELGDVLSDACIILPMA